MDWDKAFEEQAEKTSRYEGDPEKARAKSEAEFQRGVRLGWWTADGEVIEQPGEDEDCDGEGEE